MLTPPPRSSSGLSCCAAYAATPFVVLGFVAVAICDTLSVSVRLAALRLRNRWSGGEESYLSKKEMSKYGEMQVDVFDPELADWKMLRSHYIDRCIPFVLRSPFRRISDVAPPPHFTEKEAGEGVIQVVPVPILQKLEGIDNIVKKLLPWTWRAYWPFWFLGNYRSGVAHVDLGPASLNFYFLKQGRKDVVIAPKHVTEGLKLEVGIDSIFMPGTAGNHEFLKHLSSYYRITLQPQDLLVFDNSGLLHHFSNLDDDLGVTCEALSLRCKFSLGSDKRCRRLLGTCPKVWKHMSAHFLGLLTNKDGITRPEARKDEKDERK